MPAFWWSGSIHLQSRSPEWLPWPSIQNDAWYLTYTMTILCQTPVIRNYKPMPHPTPWNAYDWPRPSSAGYANRWKYCVVGKTSNICSWGTGFQFTRDFWDISAAVVVVSVCVQLQTHNLQIIHCCLHPNLFLSNCMPQYTHSFNL
jgi:hypothetical protein